MSADERTYWDAKLEEIFNAIKRIEKSEVSCRVHIEEVIADIYARLSEKKTDIAILKEQIRKCSERDAIKPHWVYAFAIIAAVIVSIIGLIIQVRHVPGLH